MLICAMIMAFNVNAELALVFLAVIPVLGVGMYLIVTRAFPIFQRVFKTYDKLNNVVGENLHGIRVVKSFVREQKEMEKFGEVSEGIYIDFSRAERLMSFVMPLMQFCIYTVMVFVLSFGSYTVITSRGLELDVGQMSALLTYSFQILMSLMTVSYTHLSAWRIPRGTARPCG